MKLSSQLIPALVGALLTLFTPSVARAAVIVANTAPQNGGAAGGQSGSLLLAAGFLSPTVATTLNFVNTSVETVSGAASISLSLYTESGGNPGSLIGLLGNQNAPLGASVQTFTPGSAIGLAAATNYFLVMSCSNCAPPPSNNWQGSPAPTVAGMAGANVLNGFRFSNNGGTTWGNVADRFALFEVNGDVAAAGIPEPSTFALTLGAAALLYFKRRR